MTNNQWQPIETAPKKTLVLVWDKQYGVCVAENFDGRYWGHEHDSYASPTHWMPLPEPPQP